MSSLRATRLTTTIAVLALAIPGAAARATTIVVNTTVDVVADDGLCSLHEAATSVNTDAASGATPGECAAGSLADDVIFALPARSVVTLNATPAIFTRSVSIWGPGAAGLEIAQGGSDRVLIFDGAAAATVFFSLIGVTVSGGVAAGDYPGAGANHGEGGGLLVHAVGGQLTIADVAFSYDSASQGGGAIAIHQRTGGSLLLQDASFENDSVDSGIAGGGGAILADLQGPAYLRRCLFAANFASNPGTGTADDGRGGALWIPPLATGSLEISETTFSGNGAFGNGGAIAYGSPFSPGFEPTVVTTIYDSTFTGNGADLDADATGRSGGSLDAGGSGALVTVTNSIFAGNFDYGPASSAPDILGGAATLASAGYNFVGIRRGAGAIFPVGSPNANHDWVGDAGSPLDPQLEPLADNGGPTRSHAPRRSPASPVLDQGSCPVAPSVSDQRGWSDGASHRIADQAAIADLDDGCDIGALELDLGPPDGIFDDGFDDFGDARLWSGTVGLAP